MPIVLTDDLQKLVLDKAAEFTDSLNNQFREAGSSTPTPSSDSLTNPLGNGNASATDTTTDTAHPAAPLPAPDAPVTAPLVAPPDAHAMLDKNGVISYVQQHAADFGLDPAAVLSVAAQEGLNTAPGSHWTLQGEGNISFGPPSWYGNGAGADIIKQHGADAAAWSWTPPGIDYWLGQVAQSAKGLVGNQAISAIVHGFERPREDLAAGEVANAQSHYATFQQPGSGLTTAGPATSSDTASAANLSDSTPSATTAPSSQPSVLDQAKAFTDNLNNQFQNATSTVGQTKDNVLQQAQAFTDGLNQKFQDASSAVGSATNSAIGPGSPIADAAGTVGNALVTPNGIDAALRQSPVSGAYSPVADTLGNSSVIGNMQTAQDLTSQYPMANTQGLLPDLDAMPPADRQRYGQSMVGVAGVTGGESNGGAGARPLFGRGGVPGGTGSPPTMPAPTQPQDLESALRQTLNQVTVNKIRAAGGSDQEIVASLRGQGVPDDQILGILHPPELEQVPTSTRPPTTTTSTAPPTAPTEPAPHVTYDQNGNVVSGAPNPEDVTPPSVTPPQPPQPPTADTLLSEPAPDAQPLRGAAANQQPKNILQRAQAAVGDVLNPAANAPKPVQDALQKFVTAKNLAVTQIQRQVDSGLLSRDDANQAIGQAKGLAQQQFLNDIRNSPQGVELKSVLAQHASIDSQGENLVGNPKPAGWVDGDPLGIHGAWVSPEINTVVKNVLNQGDSVPVLSGLANAQGQLKQIVLNSPFHAFQEAFQAIRLGAGQLDGAGTKDMLGASTVNAVNPAGFNAYMAKPETQAIVDRLVAAGGTLRQGEAGDYFNASGVKSMVVRGGIGGGISGGTTYVNDKSQGKSDQDAITDALTYAAIGAVATGPVGQVIGKGIFDRQIPTLKIEGFRMLTQNGYSDQAAASMVNQTFGGNNLQVIARSNVVQAVMRSTLLAPDWWEGFARNFLTAIPGAPVSREMGGLARRQVAATAVTAAFTLEGLNLLTTGHLTNQNQEGHQLDLEIPHSLVAGIPGAPQGTTGQMDHIDVLGPIKTMASALITMPGEGNPGDAGAFAHGRLGTLPSAALDVAQNNNPATGKSIVPPGSDTPETAGAIGGYLADRTLPIGTTGADQGTKVAGPVGGAAEYVTGMRQSSETPDQASLRGYYSQLDQKKAQLHAWLQDQPEYQAATPAAQRSMQADKDIELEQAMREQNNVAPLDKGMPDKYIGVSDPREQVQVDEAKARVDAYKTDPQHSPRPSTNDYILAAHSLDPRYTQATKARGVSNKTLDQRFQSAFTAPQP